MNLFTRKLFVFIVLCTAFCFVANCKKMNKNKLISQNWQFQENGLSGRTNTLVKFTENNEITSPFRYGEDLTYATGNYEIQGDNITLNYELRSGHECGTPTAPCSKIILKKINCKYKVLENSIYRGYIECDNKVVLTSFGELYPDGKSIQINDIKAISMGLKEYVATTELNIRTEPDIGSKKLKYIDMWTGTFDFLPKNRKFTVLARTREKDNVDKLNNYWYYVDLDECVETRWAWVYGEFIKPAK